MSAAFSPAVWDCVPGDMVAAVVVAAAAATAARAHIDGYDGAAGSGGGAGMCLSVADSMLPAGGRGASGRASGGPLVVHAATSTTYPISYVESQWCA